MITEENIQAGIANNLSLPSIGNVLNDCNLLIKLWSALRKPAWAALPPPPLAVKRKAAVPPSTARRSSRLVSSPPSGPCRPRSGSARADGVPRVLGDPRARRGRTTTEEPAVALTVWRKSLLFNCNGFTVFDASSDLGFRVDCYDTAHRGRAHGRHRQAAAHGAPPRAAPRPAGSPCLLGLRGHLRRRQTQQAAALRAPQRASKSKALAHVTPLGAAEAESEAYMVEGRTGGVGAPARCLTRAGTPWWP
ncbi:hypothetical protein BS78_01G157800 [Paspalum vaginatum]|nr:hypothetical protein BS78_01G157800 [Paspalum vaginatum]